jgi:hypothetical protein
MKGWLLILVTVATAAVGLASGVPEAAAESNASAARASCLGKRATIVGTARRDVILGTRRADVISARGGNDRITSLGGNDVVCGDVGNDVIDSGAGKDRVDGGEGNDSCAQAEQQRGCETQVVQSLVVGSGKTRLVDADRLEVKNDLVIKAGATLESTRSVLTIVAPRRLVLAGTLKAPGDIILVSHRALLPAPEELEGHVEPRVGLVAGTRAAPAAATARWVITGTITPGELVGPAEVSPERFLAAAGDGRRGPTRWLQVLGNLTLGTQVGPPQQIQARDGENGKDKDGCNKTGGNGGQGGNLVINASAVLRLHNVAISGGNGGNGGYAIGLACGGGRNTGGAGARPGMFALSAGGYLGRGTFRVDGTVSINGFNAGLGGEAIIHGLPSRPAGFSVTAVGGPGGEVKEKDRPGRPGRGFVLNFSGIRYGAPGAGWMINMARGGHAGDAYAKGGQGGHNLDNIDCNQTTGAPVPAVAGHGGDGTATGGKGGDVKVIVNAGPPVSFGPFSFVPGRGGDADANGGWGGNGQLCHWGGRGGNGGGATGAAGGGGTSTVMPPLGPGTRSTTGGGGGNGGNGALGGGNGGNGGHVNGATGGGNGGPGGNAFVPPFSVGGRGGDAGCKGGNAGPGGSGPGGSLGPGTPCP